MKACYIETWGVFLGFVVPCMGGLLVCPSGTGRIGWTWGYNGAIAALQEMRACCEKDGGVMPIFYVCDTGDGTTPCTFTEYTMRNLWKRTGGDLARCVRHGALICNETRQPDIETARKWARGEKVDKHPEVA